MKKFFSFLAAVLFAGSMMASEAIMQYTGGVTTNMVGDGANNAATVGLDADLFTVLADKGANQNLPGLNKGNDIRLYADRSTGNGNTITVSIANGTINSIVLDIKQNATFVVKAGETAVTEAGGAYAINAASFSIQNTTTGATTQLHLNKITITYTAEGGETPVEPTMDYYVAGSMTNWGPMAAYKLAANPANEGEYMGEFTFAANDEFKVGYSDGTTIESTNYFPNGIDNNYVITEAGDYTVYFRPDGQGGEDWHEGYINAVKVETPVLADPTNCAEAAEAALSVSANNELYNGGKEYSITGYVTSIQTAFNAQYSNISFWMADAADGGNVIQAYRAACASAEEAPAVGDKVTVTGKLTKYGSTPEFAAGCTYVIVEKSQIVPQNLGAKTIGEFLALKNTIDTCVLTGVVTSIVNTTYGNLYLAEGTDTLYIYGVLTPEGASKQFESLNVAEKDTLTVKAIYSEHNNAPQAKNAIFVEVKKAQVVPAETIELVFNNGGVDNYYYEDYGSTDIQLYNIPVVSGQLQGDGDFLQLEIYPADPNDISGEYSFEDEGLDDYYTYLMHIEGTDTTEIEFVDGSITVSVQNADKETSSADLTVQGQLMTAEGDVYVINTTLNVYYNFALTEEEKYQNDEEEAEFNYNFDSYQLGALSEVVVG
ncbi:MAG: hypothetical protein J5937_05020, partial [Paludibacteraceae bacterium]|nr:hypothetical protein [Paludibacteraceae bacterium]